MSNLKSVRVLDKEIERVNASDVLWCALGDPPNVMIDLTDPQETVLPFGIIRRPTWLHFYLDAPGEFVRDVNS